MAGVDFGDSELFEQLDDTAAVPTHIRFPDEDEVLEEPDPPQGRQEECVDDIRGLVEENKSLKRKLKILTRPSGIVVEDANIDGPLLQILYTNNEISRQCRQDIEACIWNVIQKYKIQGNQNNSASLQIKPQHSAFVMEEDLQVKSSSSIKPTTEAFNVVGSVLYFASFGVDKLGQPLLNENPQLTDGWEVPVYQQIYSQVIGTDGQDLEVKEKRQKPKCFNCGSTDHQLRDCPKAKDKALIYERRMEFSQGNQALSGPRYHAEETEERFSKYKPGVMSEELLAAMGVGADTLPPLIYRMRQLGYPPGWLKEAESENSGIMLYDGNDSGNISEHIPQYADEQRVIYDVSKLVDFPGFNVPAPTKMKDEYKRYDSIPMQYKQMKHIFAAYLSNNSPGTDATSNKRSHESDSTPHQRKKRRSGLDKSSDMDIDSDSDSPSRGSGGFQFQPPLPPGSPSFRSPPPLPRGTPPSTPTPPPLPKGTPPATPTNGSPALRRRDWVVVDDTVEGTEDGLTLEELEEQQRMIWAALENADTATNSDCETPSMGTPAPCSPSTSTPASVNAGTEVEDRESEEVKDTKGSAETICQISEKQGSPEVEDGRPQSPGPIKVEDDSPQIPGPIKVEDDSPQIPGPIKVEDDSPQIPGPIKVEDDSPLTPGPETSTQGAVGGSLPQSVEKIEVPHRSKFAAGIVRFEDTPEFTEVAEATGTYLRIRDVLKSSPRNMAKNKN